VAWCVISCVIARSFSYYNWDVLPKVPKDLFSRTRTVVFRAEPGPAFQNSQSNGDCGGISDDRQLECHRNPSCALRRRLLGLQWRRRRGKQRRPSSPSRDCEVTYQPTVTLRYCRQSNKKATTKPPTLPQAVSARGRDSILNLLLHLPSSGISLDERYFGRY
jgi:hypothetical protein